MSPNKTPFISHLILKYCTCTGIKECLLFYSIVSLQILTTDLLLHITQQQYQYIAISYCSYSNSNYWKVILTIIWSWVHSTHKGAKNLS